MTVLLDARPHAAAIKAAISEALGPDPETGEPRAFKYDEIPGGNDEDGTLLAIFVTLGVQRRTGGVLRSPGRAGSIGWRATFRSIGRDSDECAWAQLQIARALDSQRLLIAGRHTTRLQLETGDTPAPDDGRYSATDVYTYVH